MTENRARYRPVLAAALAAVAVAIVGALTTDLGTWYQGLRQPDWKPPDALFGPAWTLIFALCAVAGLQAWRKAPTAAAREWLLAAFALNAFLNVFWSLLFFRLHRPDWALIEVVFLWLSIALLIAICGRFEPKSRWLLLPYLVWVSFAAVLNFAVVQLNAPFN